MGYRSEVKSVIYGTKEEMAKFNNDNVVLLTALSEDFGAQLSHETNGHYELIYLNCEYSKWYDSYPDVTRWHNLLNLAKDAELKTEFVRIGEDSEGDIETDYQGDVEYYLQTECHITADF